MGHCGPTGWTNVNLFYFPDSIEITSLDRLTLWFQKLTNQNGHWHCDARFSWLLGQWLSKSLQTLLISDLQL